MQDGFRERRNVHENLVEISQNESRVLIEKILDLLLREKTESTEGSQSVDGFVYCVLIIQSLLRSSKEMKFRVQLNWSGSQVKQEIFRLYDIPPAHQVLIINDKTVSDQQTIDTFEFKPVRQAVHVFLTKKKINYEGSAIKIRDLMPEETVPYNVYDDDASLQTDVLGRKKEKRKNKRR